VNETLSSNYGIILKKKSGIRLFKAVQHTSTTTWQPVNTAKPKNSSM